MTTDSTTRLKKILVTGIGGNVGQGILRNIRASFPDIILIGTDVGLTTAGHHFCDEFEQVPYSYDLNFKAFFQSICDRHSPDLVIPATDFEAAILGEIRDELPPLIASPASICAMFLDKLTTAEAFSKHGIPFAPSCLPSDFSRQWDSIIVKPRKGRGSRGITINPDSLEHFDNDYMVQPLLDGTEITSAFYRLQDGSIRGPITFERTLAAGMTDKCWVVNDYDDRVSGLISKIVEHFPVAGPCNIQSIATTEGSVIPFEINCRYSGTNSIRRHFGFDDVTWGVEEYLFKRQPSPFQLTRGTALRVFMDIIYPEQSPESLAPGSENSKLC